MRFFHRGIRALEELDDELNCFEAGECVPGGLYRCGGGMDGVAGGVGSFCNCMSCGGECFCRSVYGLFADLDSLHQRMLVSLRELNFSRWGGLNGYCCSQLRQWTRR